MPKFKVGDKVIRNFGQRNGGWVWWDSDYFHLYAEPKKVWPKDGEYWRQRDGQVVGPLQLNARSGTIKDTGTTTRWWFATGVYAPTEDHSYDLVEKVEVCECCKRPLEKKS